LTFTTIPGAGATDATSFVGTDGVDILATFNTLTAFVGAQGGNDEITAQNINGLVDWQLKAGAGGDAVTFKSDMIGGRVNGNAGSDTLTLGQVLAGAAVFGGQNNDLIKTETVAQARVNGNLGNDTINVGFGIDGFAVDVIGASIFGGQGSDTINVTFMNATDTVIGGNLGDDFINLNFDNTDIVNGLTVNGGEGNDTITSNYRTLAAQTANVAGTGAGIVFDLGAGNDLVEASGRNDTINGGAGDDNIAGRRGADTMTGGLGQNTFWINRTTFSAKAETIVGATTVGNTDVITDWKRDTAVVGNNGDILRVAADDPARFFVIDTVYATLEDAIAEHDEANSVHLVGVGTGGSVTAFALINNNTTAAAADNINDVGAVQLGGVGIYRDTNFDGALTVDQIQFA
jgi:Ca2+-binding RTX toxin-like protein